MAEETTENGPLDDSLTSIQWLCQLESNKLLETKSEKQKPVTSSPDNRPADNCNPYRKPQYSYASLIVLAIYSSKDKRMTLQDIYSWIEDNFPYYQYAKKGWKNSIRHNLSLHKFFIKEQRADVLRGKGSYWRISPEGKENLMRDILKPPVSKLKPPIALLPHDPNRKLRHILPKPTFDPTGMQYVPLVNYNLPVVFVNETGTPVAQDPIRASPCQEQSNYYETFEMGSSAAKSISESINAAKLISESFASCPDTVVNGNENQVSKSDFEGTLPVGTPTKDILHTPIQDQRSHSKRKIAAKDSSKKRQRSSQVSKNSKPLPNILRRNKNLAVKSPDVRDARMQTPLKNNVESTLAAINSGNRTPYSPTRKSITSTLNGSVTSPSGHNRSFEFLQNCFGSPGFSPFGSPVCFGSGLTPLSQGECDSGIVITPLKSSLVDLGFNWTPFSTGLTPITSLSTRGLHSSSSTTQRCRKSLGLDQINEITEHIQSNSVL